MAQPLRIGNDLDPLEQRIREHGTKVLSERARPQPDRGRIRHWETEIQAKKANRDLAANRDHPLEAERAELGEECARVLLLLQKLARARAVRADPSEILGELSAAVLHLHAHTKGLDDAIDEFPSG